MNRKYDEVTDLSVELWVRYIPGDRVKRIKV
ncbi:uncharacterized protein QC763_0080840 [Podospora pseudopauciseta]|uniref:Uncharacterized protein n=1 Tax=Podospora pseudopauciseta TaxID=2093780 RepID=A0ABR0H7U0_9PEZI|nr:hypothetical protein QC763_0080840 [Podospora pseudopauciseta]